MKTDTILTTDEYFAACYALPKHVSPPADNARHIPITDEADISPRNKEHGCRCDRWGHPCPNCPEHRTPRLCAAADEFRL